MDRLLHGSKYYFISLRNFKIVTTQDCYFDSDNQRFAEGNYFTDVNVARACFATIREQYGGELEKIENLIERNKGKLISTISHLVDKALGKPVMGKKSEDEEEAPKSRSRSSLRTSCRTWSLPMAPTRIRKPSSRRNKRKSPRLSNPLSENSPFNQYYNALQ